MKAIIFDCFGVLATDGWLPFKRKHFGNDPHLEAQATDLSKQLNSGLIDYDGFVREVAALAGISERQTRAAIENHQASEMLFDYIARYLKPRYKLGVLSNAGSDWTGEMFRPEQMALFDAVALSYQTGFLKPDQRAYIDIANRLGVEPADCVFVDDQERHCAAARDTGMSTVLYTDFDDARQQLERLLSI